MPAGGGRCWGGGAPGSASGQARGARGKHQRAADLAAISAAQVMRDLYPRLFEPAVLPDGCRTRAISRTRCISRSPERRPCGARAATGCAVRATDELPGRIVRPDAGLRWWPAARGACRRRAAAADAGSGPGLGELSPNLGAALGMPAFGSGGGYDGPLAYRMGKPMRPDIAAAFDRMAAAARREAGPRRCRSPAAFARTPSRRGCSPPTRTRSGSPRRARACTATPPSSTSAAGRLRLAGGQRPPVRLHPPLRLGALALRARANPRDREHPALYDQGSGSRRRPRASTITASRASCRLASTIRSPARRCAGTCR